MAAGASVDSAPSGQVRRLVLHGVTGSVPRCREFTRAALSDWGWLTTEDGARRMAAEDVLLMVSELVANACMHAGGPSELVLRRASNGVHVEVTDGSPLLPTIRTDRPSSAPTGHGLRVVDRLATAWGTTPTAAGKTVWVEVELPRE